MIKYQFDNDNDVDMNSVDIHLIHPLPQFATEFTLCGVFMDSGNGCHSVKITCPDCIEMIKYCKVLQV